MSGKITSNITGIIRTSVINATYKSYSLIYCIICTMCGTQYFGQMKRWLIDRFQEHYYNICKGTKQIGQHFTCSDQGGIKDL